MADVGRHPNIRVLTNTDITAVEGEAGNFTVSVTRRPRYVDEELCRGCRTCAVFCPYRMPNPFDENLSEAKAIDIWCGQAIPAVPVIEREKCLYFQEKKCMICVPVCQSNAIDFTQKRKRGVMHVGAIIVTPGYEVFDARLAGEYGYGRMKNVVTSLEFERLLDADGPHKGEVLRQSDGTVPQKIAWLQCVGSRDVRLGRSYCSSVCCTYAIKQAMLVKQHYPETQVTIFHNDIRTHGKGFEDLYNRAQLIEGLHFTKTIISDIKENRTDNNLVVQYLSDDHTMLEEEFGLAVLSVGMAPSAGNPAMARIMDLDLNKHGFCETDGLSSNAVARRPGIFPAATFTGPMDIPDAISSAAGAGSLAAQLLSEKRGSLTQTREYPTERAVDGEVPKIGVFVCHCGTNIAGVADIDALVQYTSTLTDVAYCDNQLISCASDSLLTLSEAIREKGLNRIVIAACSPRDHEAGFREALRDAGLNPYLLEMANIREHCTWVHMQEKEEATAKAKDIIAMSVARARNLSPIYDNQLPVNKKGLVLGGGPAGMTAAAALAGQGFEVYLVEKEATLGGNLRNRHFTLEEDTILPFLTKLIDRVEGQEKITIYKGYEIKSVTGFVGNFISTLATTGSGDTETIALEHGIIIVATGGKAHVPDEYHYSESKKIISQQELEEMIATEALPRDLKQVAMIQCVGVRNEERPYCSRICCGQALKNALKLKALNADLDVFVFYRDMRVYGFREDYYHEAREKGVTFIRYEAEDKPEVSIKGQQPSVTFYEPMLESKAAISPDLLVLSTPVLPEGNQEVAQLLHVPLTKDGFFMEAHLKLKPLDFALEGMFLCGMAHYPKFITETISQANGAALRAATILSQDTVETSGAVSEVDEDACIGCGLCEKACLYSAISLQSRGQEKIAAVVPALCKGCGVCGAVCSSDAVSIKHSTDVQIAAQIDSAYSVPMVKSRPKILAFLCNWCGYPGADLAGVSRIQYAPNIRVIKVMCSGRIHSRFIYQAFLNGFDAVLVVGCHMQDCHYITGIEQTVKTLKRAHKAIEKIGIDPERLRMEQVSAAEGAKFADAVNAYSAAMDQLGPLKVDSEQKEKLLELKA
jgi:heterodisulfide reductase subunit A